MALIRAVLAAPDFGFDISDADGHVVRMDIPVSQGGGGTGLRPMQSLLAALCGCSGVDIVRILRKQRQQMTSLEMQIDGTRGSGGDLALWEHIALQVRIGGVVEPAKARRAVALSIDAYCSVAETLRRAGATITWRVEVNGVPVPDEA